MIVRRVKSPVVELIRDAGGWVWHCAAEMDWWQCWRSYRLFHVAALLRRARRELEKGGPPGREFVAIPAEDAQLVLGALDSLATALADHGHVWTDGEREIYELAVRFMQVKKPAP